MKPYLIKILALFIAVTVVFSVSALSFSADATSLSELQSQQKKAQQDLAEAKKNKADQQEIKEALDKQIAATQAIIDQYNAQIRTYNAQISAKENEIDQKNKEIEADKLQFKKRIRAIHMSNTQSSVQVLMGAESFSDYLTLARMAKNVAAHDKALVDKIVEAVSQIQAEKAEIQALLNEQAEAKKAVDAKKAELDAQVSEVQSVINQLDRDINADLADLKRIADEIDKQSAPVGGDPGGDYAGLFLWPSSRFFYVSAVFDGNDSVHKGNHKGIDIAGSGIKGTPIRAAAAGTVYAANNSCPHNYNKSRSCGCGGGYGNYVGIDHGPYQGNHYKTFYAHMTSNCVSVGQHVERGQTIGYVGTTGWSTGPHIHFETIMNGTKVNPQRFSYSK